MLVSIKWHYHYFTPLTFISVKLFSLLEYSLKLNILYYYIGADKLRAAEREAKQKRNRLWADYQPPAVYAGTGKEKDFTGNVFEVFNGDAISVKMPSGQLKKVFLSSIRPPREAQR